MAENILINFEVDSSGLAPAVDQLEKLGTIDKQTAAAFRATNVELAKRNQQLGNTLVTARQAGTQTKKSIDDLDKAVLTMTQDIIAGMQEGVIEALEEAGVSAAQFGTALKKSGDDLGKSTTTIKTRLNEIRQELASMKAAGQDNTEAFETLTNEAGRLQKAVGDAAQGIKNAAANSKGLEGLIGTMQGVAAGFTVAQSASALFGERNEDLQEVLLRVNAAMALLQGLQQINNLLQKESAAATFLATVAQRAYNIVVGETIGLLRVLRIAFAATGIGAVILGITVLVQWLTSASKATKQLTQDFMRFNLEAERNLDNFKKNIGEVRRSSEEQQAILKATGALQSEISKENIRGLKDELVGIFELQQGMRGRKDEAVRLLTEMAKGERKFNENLANEAQKTIDTYNDLGEQRLNIASRVRQEEVALARQLTDEAKAAAEERKRLAEEAAQRERELRAQRLQDELAALERQLLAAETAGTETLRIEQQVIAKKAEISLNAEKLTANEILLIKERSASDQLKLAQANAKKLSDAALEGLIAQNNAELTQLNLSAAERLRLQEENIITAAQLEVNAAENNASKIKAIEAKRDADIRANRLRSIQEAVDYEIQLQQARSGAYLRENEKIASDTEASQAERFAAIDELTNHEIEAIDKRQAALNKQLQDGLISRRDYDLQYEQLADQAEEAVEKSEQRKTDILKAEEQKRREEIQRTVDFTIETTQQVLQVLQEFFSQQSEAELAQVDEQRKRIEELRETGAITEKEAQARLKRLDQEERKIRAQQAQRDKQIAIFNAVINTAQAFTRALATGGPVFAAIVAALGAAQIALIASRPIPKFGKGKKNNYEGLAEIGETGSELVEKNGQLYVAPARTIVWLGAKDKVYNPEETRHMLEARGGRAQQIKRLDAIGAASNSMDYEKLGKVIARNTPGLSLNIDGYKDFVIQGHAFNTYLNNRRSYK